MKSNSLHKIWNHPVIVASCNILLVMLLYSMARMFFYSITRASYNDMSTGHLVEIMSGGMRFDLTAVLYLSSLYLLLELLPLRIRENVLYQRVAQWTFWIPNIAGIFTNCADMVYVQYTDRRTTIAFFSEFENENNLTNIFFTAVVQYWYVTLFFIVSCAILIWLTRCRVECSGSMGFQAYARSAGFAAYYGMTEYENVRGKNDFDGVWAIWDEEFLQYYAEEMSMMSEPFMTAVFTASSHHPFQVPERYGNTFPKGTLPIHQCIGYTDNALRKFFDYAQKQAWFANTLFVITADHTNQLAFEEYNNDKGVYEVPILFYSASMPDSLLNIEHTEPISQTDIMPSVLEYVGYGKTYFAFGQDALTKKKAIPYAINYNNGLYQIFSDRLLVQFDGNKVAAIYDFKSDRLLKKNLAVELQDSEEVQNMLKYLKAYLQQYTNRLIDNRFTISAE